MDNLKKLNSFNHNEKNIEKQIFTMLENVLKEDSDETVEPEKIIQKAKNKNQSNKNKLPLNFQNKEKKLFIEEELDKMHSNINRVLNKNYENDLEKNYHQNIQKQINYPKIFINNIPVSIDIDSNDNRELVFNHNKNNSPLNFKQIPHFNNLSPISKQFKNQSPRNNKVENDIINFQAPITNRLSVAHIGMNMAYNNIIVNNSPKMGAKANTIIRNNTINHSLNKLNLNNIGQNSFSSDSNRYLVFLMIFLITNMKIFLNIFIFIF